MVSIIVLNRSRLGCLSAAALSAALVCLVVAGTTTANASTFTYDLLSTTRIDAVAAEACQAAFVPAIDSHDEFVSLQASGEVALSDPPSTFATTESTASMSEAVHGNSRLSDKQTSLYQLYDNDGTYLKTGVTSTPGARYTQGYMIDKHMGIINVGSRSNMLDLERTIVELDPGPLNREPWAVNRQ